MKRRHAAALLILVSSSAAFAQIEARTATPEDLGGKQLQEIANPMLLDLSLGPRGTFPGLNDEEVTERTFYETKKFVVDKARIGRVQIKKEVGRKGAVKLAITTQVGTEYSRQDLDLTVAIVSDGKVIRTKTWDDLTVGADNSKANRAAGITPFAAFGGSSTKWPLAEFSFKPGEFEALYGSEPPLLRIVVDVQGDE
jgi:hypothetical protein